MSQKDSIHETSLKSLIEWFVSGEASAAQLQELERRLLEDDRARDEYLEYMNLHASLRRWFLTGNEEQSLDTELADLSLVLSRDGLENASPRPRRLWFAAFVVLSCALLALAVFQATGFRQPHAPSESDLPLIMRVVGEVRVKTTSGLSENAAVGKSVRVGETLLVEGEDEVVLRYTDGTRIELVGAATLAVGRSPQSAKQLELQSGTLQADVAVQPAERPLLIVTPHARVRVLATRFELATDSEEGTRLDLESGRVELLRGAEKPLAVEPNSIATVPSTPDPIRITPRPAVVDSPRRETEFPGLMSARFSADASTVVAATRWQAVYWYDDDRLEAVPFSPEEKKGIYFHLQAKTLLAFARKEAQAFALWDTVKREPIHLVDDCFGDEPPDRWHRTTNVTALSPQGDWVALQRGRRFRLWDTQRRRWLDYADRYDSSPMSAMASSDDGRLLAIAVRRNMIDVMNAMDGRVVASWQIQHLVPTSLAFSANGQRLAASFVGRLKVYDVATAEEVSTVHQPTTTFLRVAISPDGRCVAASTRSRRIQMWDVDSQAELPMLDVGETVRDLAFAADGEWLAVVTKGRMGVWEVGGDKPEVSYSESK